MSQKDYECHGSGIATYPSFKTEGDMGQIRGKRKGHKNYWCKSKTSQIVSVWENDGAYFLHWVRSILAVLTRSERRTDQIKWSPNDMSCQLSVEIPLEICNDDT